VTDEGFEGVLRELELFAALTGALPLPEPLTLPLGVGTLAAESPP
jgi:hypothetical protein